MNERVIANRETSGRSRRILIYSHDTFGLGHLRRCRALAHSLVAGDKDLTCLILSGSPIIGSFNFRTRVDFVRIPGVIKLRNGDYTALSLHMDIDETLALRASIIEHTAKVFKPDLFLVDKEPLGLRGEVEPTLKRLKDAGVPLILGLRDVLDEPEMLAPEWERKQAIPALKNYYDDIWVYGLPQICEPLAGLPIGASITNKLKYTGYLRRHVPDSAYQYHPPVLDEIKEPYILVTPGGGGDGEALIDWVLRAYESDPNIPFGAIIVFGPFMAQELQADFFERAGRLERVAALTFDSQIETLMTRAAGIVAMGGYNTFCEVLSFDKPALVMPRTIPRMEQYLRISRAQQLGLVSMIDGEGERDAQDMATALRQLPQQPRPSQSVVPGLLDGLTNVDKLTHHWLAQERRPRISLVDQLLRRARA